MSINEEAPVGGQQATFRSELPLAAEKRTDTTVQSVAKRLMTMMFSEKQSAAESFSTRRQMDPQSLEQQALSVAKARYAEEMFTTIRSGPPRAALAAALHVQKINKLYGTDIPIAVEELIIGDYHLSTLLIKKEACHILCTVQDPSESRSAVLEKIQIGLRNDPHMTPEQQTQLQHQVVLITPEEAAQARQEAEEMTQAFPERFEQLLHEILTELTKRTDETKEKKPAKVSPEPFLEKLRSAERQKSRQSTMDSSEEKQIEKRILRQSKDRQLQLELQIKFKKMNTEEKEALLAYLQAIGEKGTVITKEMLDDFFKALAKLASAQ